jgi:O-antigen/teichoic acid export membrane protein
MGILQRQSIKSSVATYIGVGVGYVNLILLFPKFLQPEQLGLTRVLIAMAAIFSQVALIGTPFALVRFFPYFRNKEQRHHGFPALMLRIALIGFAVVSIFFLVMKEEMEQWFRVNSPLFSQHYLFVFPMALFMLLSELGFNYCRSLMKLPIPVFFKEVMLRIFQTFALLMLISHLVTFEQFVVLFVLSYFLQLLLMSGYIIYLQDFFFFSEVHLDDKVSFRQILRFSLFSFAAASVAIYTANIDTVLLGVLANLQSVAVYNVAFFIGTIIQVPARTMNMIASSIIADAWKLDDRRKIQELYTQTSLNQLIIGGFLFLLLWVNVDLLLSLLPAIYSQARWVIFIIGVGKLFDMATGINGEIISVSRHVKVGLITNLFLIIITTVANYLMIPIYGIYGAAIATALSLFVYNVIRMIFLYYQYQLQPFNTKTFQSLVLLMLCFIFYYLLPDKGDLWFNAAYKSIILSIAFLSPLLIFKISPEISAAYRNAVMFIIKRININR